MNAMLKMVKYVEKFQASTIQKFWGTIDTKFNWKLMHVVNYNTYFLLLGLCLQKFKHNKNI